MTEKRLWSKSERPVRNFETVALAINHWWGLGVRQEANKDLKHELVMNYLTQHQASLTPNLHEQTFSPKQIFHHPNLLFFFCKWRRRSMERMTYAWAFKAVPVDQSAAR